MGLEIELVVGMGDGDSAYPLKQKMFYFQDITTALGTESCSVHSICEEPLPGR